MPDSHERGIYRKFEVSRTDGKSEPGKKHHGCNYFVLDLDHDEHAVAAIAAYAASCRAEHPALAVDLDSWVAAQKPCGCRSAGECGHGFNWVEHKLAQPTEEIEPSE